MKRVVALIACALPLAFTSAATASSATHETAGPTGDTFVCDDGETHMITGGTLKVTTHEDENAAGGFSFTSTIVPPRVTAVNSSGEGFRAVGAVLFGATGNPAGSVQSTFTFSIQLMSVGGGRLTASSSSLTRQLLLRPRNLRRARVERAGWAHGRSAIEAAREPALCAAASAGLDS